MEPERSVPTHQTHPSTQCTLLVLGQQLVAAGNSGRVHLYDVHESLHSPKASEWDDLANTLTELKLVAGEGELSNTASSIF